MHDIAEAPPALLQFLNDKAAVRTVAPEDIEFDTPENEAKALIFLRNHKPATEGQGGDNATLQTFLWLRDLGISRPRAVELTEESGWNDRCHPRWARDELEAKAANAYAYGQNAAACDATPPVREMLEKALPGLLKEAGTSSERKHKFYALTESEQDEAPDPKWLIPGYFPENSIGMITGQSGSGKTFFILNKSYPLAAEGKTVVYVAAEGAHGIKKLRRPALKKALGITGDVRFFLVEAMPIANSDDVRTFVADMRAQNIDPDLVVLDTLNYAIPGQDENAASTASLALLMAKEFQMAFSPCTVIFVHHEGKGDPTGYGRGSSAIFAGMDFVYLVESDRESKTATVKQTKLKDGEPWTGSRRYQVEQSGASVVFKEIGEDEYAAQTRKTPPLSPAVVGRALVTAGAIGGVEVSTTVLARTLAGPDVADDLAAIKAVERRLQRGARDVLAAYATGDTGKGGRLKWTFPKVENLGADDEL